MRILRYVVFAVAMATISRTASSLELKRGHQISQRQRRFLFTNQNFTTNKMCSMFCPLVCTQGYVKSTQGCFLCQCVVDTSTTIAAQNFLQPSSAINGGVFLDKPCNPAVRHCRLQCRLGFLEGTNGCQYCACRSSEINTALPTLSPTTVTYTGTVTRGNHTQRTTTLSGLTTVFPTEKSTVPISTAKVTTRNPILPNENYNDPCISSQKTCSKNCGGSYVKGPGGCQYCLCATDIPTGLTSTTTSAPGNFEKNATVVSKLDLSSTSEACIMAKVICNQKCDHGFVSHPDDCLFCSCQQPSDVASSDDPNGFIITFPKPCVENRVTCGIMCRSGYVMGPRDCKFCSCR